MADKSKTTLKYPLLGNRQWLHDQYVNNKLSTTEISNIVGCSKDGVRAALLRHKIKLRSAVASNAIKFKKRGFASKYEKLNDKEWLIEQYQTRSLQEISDIVGAKNGNSVRQALLFYGIDLRDRSEAQTLNRDGDSFVFNKSVIDGCLLGDAGLRCWKKESDISMPCFFKRNKFYDHVSFVGRILFGDDYEDRIKEEFRNLNGKKHPCFLLRSLTHESLIEYWNRWYPASTNFKKIVPQDIVVDETLLLHWFLDDGSTSYRQRKLTQVRLTFCTESFAKADQEMLCDKANDVFGLQMRVFSCNSGTGHRIRVPQAKVWDFFEIIGSCPVPSMKYKWKVPNLKDIK